MSSTKATLQAVGEHWTTQATSPRRGADRLVETVAEFASIARTSGCGELMAFATSAVRDAGNSDAVLDRVRAREPGSLSTCCRANDEARLTFLAVRRWYGWSAGRILNLDIGGGSLELTFGGDEDPDVAYSLQIGAGRLTRDWFREDPPGKRRIAVLRDWLDAELVEPSQASARTRAIPTCASAPRRRSGSLARLTGAAPSSAGPRVTADTDRERTPAAHRLHLPDDHGGPCRTGGCELGSVPADSSPERWSPRRACAHSAWTHCEICPWALREGLILRKLDTDMGGELVVTAG